MQYFESLVSIVTQLEREREGGQERRGEEKERRMQGRKEGSRVSRGAIRRGVRVQVTCKGKHCSGTSNLEVPSPSLCFKS